MDRTKNSPSNWATPPYCWAVSSRATRTVATMLSPLAIRPPTARGPAWRTPPTKDSLRSESGAPPVVSAAPSTAEPVPTAVPEPFEGASI